MHGALCALDGRETYDIRGLRLIFDLREHLTIMSSAPGVPLPWKGCR